MRWCARIGMICLLEGVLVGCGEPNKQEDMYEYLCEEQEVLIDATEEVIEEPLGEAEEVPELEEIKETDCRAQEAEQVEAVGENAEKKEEQQVLEASISISTETKEIVQEEKEEEMIPREDGGQKELIWTQEPETESVEQIVEVNAEELCTQGGQRHEILFLKEEGNCEQGEHEYEICVYCGVIANEKWIGTGKEHSYVWVPYSVATCTQPGWLNQICDICGASHPSEPEMEQPALGHDWREEVELIGEATCFVGEVKRYTCRRCGQVEEKVGQPLGHEWMEGTITKEQLETGLVERIPVRQCSRCRELVEVMD